MTIENLVIMLADQGPDGVTDITVSDSGGVHYKKKAEWIKVDPQTYDPASFTSLLAAIVPGGERRASMQSLRAVENCVGLGNHRFRISLTRNEGGCEIVFRPLESSIPSPEKIGLDPRVVDKFCELSHGLFLVVGPTGMGKSTTIASLVDELCNRRSTRVITIEDPMERLFPKYENGSNVAQRQVDLHVESFTTGIKEAMRQRPNVIIVQEIRFVAEAEVAIMAGLSGHLVVSTMHSATAQSALQRLASFFGGRDVGAMLDSLATALVGVIAQRLVQNSETGAVVSLHEVCFANKAIKELIRKQEFKLIPQTIENCHAEGMTSFSAALDRRCQARLLPWQMMNNFNFGD